MWGVDKKVVINKCYGGFGLSAAAITELYTSGFGGNSCGHVEAIPLDEYFKNSYRDLKTRAQREEYIKTRGQPIVGDKVLTDDHSREEHRDCAALVAIVEAWGERADGEHAQLKVVSIPGDISFEIDEYDGIETIAETHRTWG